MRKPISWLTQHCSQKWLRSTCGDIQTSGFGYIGDGKRGPPARRACI